MHYFLKNISVFATNNFLYIMMNNGIIEFKFNKLIIVTP